MCSWGAGLNNDFLIKTHNDLALTYNDISPLEMFHSAASAKVLRTHRFMEVRRLLLRHSHNENCASPDCEAHC